MPQATIKCLQYVTGPGRSRQPRSPMPGAYPPGLGPVSCYTQQPPNTYVTGTPFAAPYPIPPAVLPCISTYKFAFQSVTGLVEGGQISTNIAAPCSGTVGTVDIVVTNVYAPFGGGTGPAGENGAIIDAFNAETGEFCDDTFVTVSPDGTGGLTTSGNVLGWVSSANAETITALGHILPSNMYFSKWQIVDGIEQTAPALAVVKNANLYAFAFYGHLHKSFWKDFKDNFKEHKEWLSDKPRLVDNPVKDLGAELPKWKDAAYEVDPTWRDTGDPAERLKMQTLIDKVSALEKQLSRLGQSFIKVQERPAVGKEIAEKGNKNR